MRGRPRSAMIEGMGVRIALAALLACVLAGSSSAAVAAPPPPPASWLEPCGESWCGTFEVLENRADPGGRRIALKVVVVPAASPSLRSHDAIAYLAGGPGEAAATGGAAAWLPSTLSDATTKHDLLLVDQRGTGDSGALSCPLPIVLPAEPTPDQVRVWWSTCLGGLDADPRFYGTADAVDDLDEVRAALGYERLHLFGISYGTVVAQTFLLRHPEHVRTVVLDSGVALGTRPFERWARSYQEAFDRLVARCGRSSACRTAFPDPAHDLTTVLTRLARTPARVGGTTVDRDLFVGLVQTLTESSRSAAVVPLFLRTAAARGTPAAVEGLGRDVLDALVAITARPPQVMFYAIVCSEPWAAVDPVVAARSSAGTYLGESYVRSLTVRRAMCDATPRTPALTGADAPVPSTVPTLLAMGAEDPKLPAPTIASVRAVMPNAAVAVVRTAGHGTIVNRCVQRLVDRLMVTGTTMGLDTGCARRQSFPPFVLRWSDWS